MAQDTNSPPWEDVKDVLNKTQDELETNDALLMKELHQNYKLACEPKHLNSFLQRALISGSLDTICLLLSDFYDAKHMGRTEDFDGLEYNENLKTKTETEIRCRKIAKFLLHHNLNLPGSEYSLLLHFVLICGDDETFKLVLYESKNFEVHALGPQGQTILHYAVYENKKSYIKHLIDYGMDINIGDFAKRTALHYAVRQNNPELVYYFLNLGANVNKKTAHSGYTPLHVAVAVGNKEIIDMLLNSGADMKAKCYSGRMMGPRCIINHRSSVLNFVCGRSVLRRQLSKPEINYSDEFEMTFINKRNSVKMVFDKEMIKFLLERGAETEVFDFSCDENSATPLHRACETGRLDIVQLLLDYGAYIYATDSYERSMLHYAVLGNNFHIVDLLLQKGFDINARDKYGLTPLYNFVKENVVLINGGYKNMCRISMLDFLADNGADINIHCGTLNNTLLHCVGCVETPHLIETLLELIVHCKANHKNKHGYEPFTDKFFSKNLDRITESGKVLIAFRALIENNFYNINECEISKPEAWKLANVFFEKCKLEIKKMINTNFCNENHATFYTFLTIMLIKASKFAKNEKIMQVLETGKYKTEFPCYAFLLEKRIERVLEILNIENCFVNFLEKCANMKLPVPITDRILGYLSIGDLRNFGRALLRLKKENYGVICR